MNVPNKNVSGSVRRHKGDGKLMALCTALGEHQRIVSICMPRLYQKTIADGTIVQQCCLKELRKHVSSLTEMGVFLRKL